MRRSHAPKLFEPAVILLGLLLTSCAAGDAQPALQGFEDLCRKAGNGASEDEIKTLLTKGRELCRPQAASNAFRIYMGKTAAPSQQLLRMSAEIALLAGDYSTAVSRYKTYLRNATPDAESAEAAGQLSILLVDLLRNEEDAYQFLNGPGVAFRLPDSMVRWYDGWFMGVAQRHRDYPAAARKLVQIFSDKTALEVEQAWWPYMDWIFEETMSHQRAFLPVVEPLKQLSPLYRADPVRKARFDFYVTALEVLAADEENKSARTPDELHKLRASANAYLNVSLNAETIRDIVITLIGGKRNFDDRFHRANPKFLQDFFVAAFEKLSDFDREDLVNWWQHGRPMVRYLASLDQWMDLATKHAELFKKPNFRYALTIWEPRPAEFYVKQAAYTAGLENFESAACNALAGQTDLGECIRRILTQESWYLTPNQPRELFTQRMWPVFAAYPREKGKELPKDYDRQMWRIFALEGVAKTPIAFDTPSVHDALQTLWQLPDKGPFLELLTGLEWVPYNEVDRKKVFEEAFNWFKAFKAQAAKPDGGGIPGDQLASARPKIPQIETAFNVCMSQHAHVAAPNSLCDNLALAILAGQQKNKGEFTKHCQALYQEVKDFDSKKIPWGSYATIFLLQEPIRQFRSTDIPCQILSDQFVRLGTTNDPNRVEWCISQIQNAGEAWNWGTNIQPADRELIVKVGSVVEENLLTLLKTGKFWTPLFDKLRTLRGGPNWRDEKLGTAFVSELIERKTLTADMHLAGQPVRSATVRNMQLVNQEFPELRTKYPLNSYFDQMFIEEIKKTGFIDTQYWDYGGQDLKKVIANQIARKAAEWKTLPRGYNEPVGYSEGELWRLHQVAMGAEEALRKAYLQQIESYYGKSRYDNFASGFYSLWADLRNDDDRKRYFERTAEVIKRAGSAPMCLESIPQQKAQLSTDEIAVLRKLFPPFHHAAVPPGWDQVIYRLPAAMIDGSMENDLLYLAPFLWQWVRDTGNTNMQPFVTSVAQSLFEKKQFPIVVTFANAGLEVLGNSITPETKTNLSALRMQALTKLGDTGNRVDSGDPNFGIFEAQAAFVTGNNANAWELYNANALRMKSVIKELDPNFVLWIISRNTELRRYEISEELCRSIIEISDKNQGLYEPDMRAHLAMAYADLAFARQEYPRARAQYENVSTDKEFENTRAQIEARLRVAEVDRLTKQYDRAMTKLTGLVQSHDKVHQAQAYYQMALIHFDQEDWKEAAKCLDEVFLRVPDHPAASILNGKVNLKQKKLEEATQLPIGLSLDQQSIVPGKPLRIDVEDRNLSIAGKSVSIEIRVWAESGDEEFVNLLPLGDSKTKFRGQLPTALGAPSKGDHILQILGSDKVHYDFSDAFKKAHRISDNPTNTLTVVTDAELYVSSGKILSREEQTAQDLERNIRERLAREAGKAEKPDVALSTLRATDQVKPGNSINVRVVDADQCVSNGKNQVKVKVEASSGDAIDEFSLSEVAPFTGVFEGAMPTAPGPATAYASDSDEGRQPDYMISTGNFPAWVALPDNRRPKAVSVDLRDNVNLGKMTILANDEKRKLKSFAIQTSMNGITFDTIGRFPGPFKPWDGSPQIEVVRLSGPPRNMTLEEFKNCFEKDFIKNGTPKFSTALKSMAVQLDANVLNFAGAMQFVGLDWYVLHIQGFFYQPKRVSRSFVIQIDKAENIFPLLILDGENPAAGQDPCRITRLVQAGVHRLDSYAVCFRHVNRSLEVQCDQGESPQLARCPDEMFDAGKHPEISEAVKLPVATVAADTGGTRFDIAFGSGSHSRVIRLLLEDFESDAPAIQKISLTNSEEQQILPTKEDLTLLRKNQILEIIPGDKITVTYHDPKVLTPSKAVLEGRMSVTYNNATLSACFEEAEIVGNGERRVRYIPIRRFKAGDAVTVCIKDPDGDISDKQDTLTFTARAGKGKPIQVQALETEEHSGVFVARIFPVTGQPQRPIELQTGPGDDIRISYLDKENTDPGIPWDRTYQIEQAVFGAPELTIYEVASVPLPATDRGRLTPTQGTESAIANEYLRPAFSMIATKLRNEKSQATAPVRIPACGPLIVEALCPEMALSVESEATIYVQTAAGRAKKKSPANATSTTFDITVPGTIKLTARACDASEALPAPPGYSSVVVNRSQTAGLPLEDGRFTFVVPLELGPVPAKSLADDAWKGRNGRDKPPALQIRGDDEIFIGFRFKDENGAQNWVVRKVVLTSDVFFEVMDRRYQESVDGLYVGDKAYFRVIHLTRDVSDKKDSVEVTLTSKSGKKQTLPLVETFEHSGVFKGVVNFVYAVENAPANDPNSFPVVYGDEVTASYGVSDGVAPLTRTIQIFKGADGSAVTFTKRFTDASIAMKTQFSIAEAWFELAKKHRSLGDRESSLQEIAQGKKVLEEALHDYTDPDAQAQVEYLLANLSMEYAEDTANESEAKNLYLEAIQRFSDFISSYPDNSNAPKAQFKKALAYEKMGQIDQACEEYVKLSYRYPDNELVAETIYRLGQYFMKKGRGMNEQADAQKDPVEAEKLRIQAADTLRTAGQVLERLSARFPEHALAGQTRLLAGNAFFLANELPKAIEVLKALLADPNRDKNVAAEAMYLASNVYLRNNDALNAYRMLKHLTLDYPDSKWAHNARGELTDDKFSQIEANAAAGDGQ